MMIDRPNIDPEMDNFINAEHHPHNHCSPDDILLEKWVDDALLGVNTHFTN